MLGQARKEREKEEEGKVYYFEGRKLVYGPLGFPVMGDVELIQEFTMYVDQPPYNRAHVMVYRAWIGERTPVFIATLWFENTATGEKSEEKPWGVGTNNYDAIEDAAKRWEMENPNAEYNPFSEVLKGNVRIIDYLSYPSA